MDLMAIAFPFNDPVAVKLGPLAIRWYGLAYMAGLLLGWLYMRRLCADERLWGEPSPMRPEQADDFLFWATLGTVIGGRLGFFLFYEPAMLFSHPLQFFRIWEGGMAFHGGILGVGLAIWLFGRRNRIPVRSLMDLSAAVVPFGLFFGRIANFINSEVVGRVSPRAMRLARAIRPSSTRRLSKAPSCSSFCAISRTAACLFVPRG